MSFNSLRLEYALEGSSNYVAWKDRMEAVLDDNGLKDFIEAKVPKPAHAAQVEDVEGFCWRALRITLYPACMEKLLHI